MSTVHQTARAQGAPQLSTTQPGVQPPPGSVSQLAYEGEIWEVSAQQWCFMAKGLPSTEGKEARLQMGVSLGAGVPGMERPH